MPSNATDIRVTVRRNGTGEMLARVVGNDAANITQASLTSVKYTIYELDEDDPDSRTAVAGHSAVAVTISTSVFNTLQTDAVWTKDATGYNFAHTPSIGTNDAFGEVGVDHYLLEYTFTPADGGQVFKVGFRVSVI